MMYAFDLGSKKELDKYMKKISREKGIPITGLKIYPSEYSEKMCLSPKTVCGYRDALFTKCRVKNRVGLVTYAIKNKIYTV
jgi:hypothetical protein